MKHLKIILLSAACTGLVLALAACGGNSGNDQVKAHAEPISALPTGQVALIQSLGRVGFKGGASVDLSEGFTGLALRYTKSSGASLLDTPIYAITGRGPAVYCNQSGAVIGVKNFCKNVGTDDSGVVLAQPDYAPKILKFQIAGAPKSKEALKLILQKTIKITDREGKPVGGRDIPLSVAQVRNDYGPDSKRLSRDPEGINPQGIAALKDKTFWVADNLGPSLLHIAASGSIINRIVPSNEVTDLGAAGYQVSGGLPAILSKRALGRGIQAVAASADDQKLYFTMASALANPNRDAASHSRNVRIFVAKLDNGRFAGLAHEYVIRLEKPDRFYSSQTGRGDKNADQQDVKISDMTALSDQNFQYSKYGGNGNFHRADGKLALVERTPGAAKLVQVSLASASDILGSDYDSGSAQPTLAQLDDFKTAGVQPAATKQVFSSLDKRIAPDKQPAPRLPDDIEGFTLLPELNAPWNLIFGNFNDYGLRGAKSQITLYNQ